MPSATESGWGGTCLWPQHLWGEPGGSQGHPWLHSLFRGSLGHMRPCWGRERGGERSENGREIDSQVEVGRLSLCIRLRAVSQHWVTVTEYVTKKKLILAHVFRDSSLWHMTWVAQSIIRGTCENKETEVRISQRPFKDMPSTLEAPPLRLYFTRMEPKGSAVS